MIADDKRPEPNFLYLVGVAAIGSIATGASAWHLGFEIAEALLAMPLGGSTLAGVAGAALARNR